MTICFDCCLFECFDCFTVFSSPENKYSQVPAKTPVSTCETLFTRDAVSSNNYSLDSLM